MAELIVVVVRVALDKTTSMALDKIKLIRGYPKQLDKMKGHVQAIEAVLADADSKKSGGDSHRVIEWLKKVEEAAFEAEIVLDELLYDSLRRQVLKNNGGAPQVCKCSPYPFTLLKSKIQEARLSRRFGPRVRSINAKFQDYISQIQPIGFVERVRPATYVETDSLLYKPLVAGRDEEESEIVDKLLSGSSNDNPLYPVLVLPIVGMGGIGKTTLAKLIYNNQQIEDRFPKRSWTCVSNKGNDTDIFKKILESLKEESNQNVGISGREAIVRGIRKELGGERFLFVIDGVWDDWWWKTFFDSLIGLKGASGSCCVLTQRLKNNNYSYYFKPFELKGLSNDNCWSIISRMATKGEVEQEPCLNAYKEQLLKKCQGLPLAAKVIGSLLGSYETKDWTSIMENAVMKNVHGSVNSILRLSYDYLPSRCLKSCFVYCSVYPKGAEMDGDELIKLWMAQGYLEDDAKEGETMEEVGANYLAILSQSSLLEKCGSWSWCWSRGWGYRTYQMHDLVHDLAESISKERHDRDRSSAFRHVALGVEKLKDCWNEESTLARVREGDIYDARLSECIHARVMHLYFGRKISSLYFGRKMKFFYHDFGKLIHLRSLTISGYFFETLPESLCCLYNLQTLKLSDCRELKCLPQGLINLISLRHLHFLGDEEFKMPPNMGQLTCLRTLEFFNVREENGHEIKELGSMKNLRGSLSLRNLELVKGKEEGASLAKLDAKKYMTELELKWGSITTRRNWKDDEEVLKGLEPCSALQRLTIQNYMGFRFPEWLGELSALVSLRLNDCKNITELGYSGDSGFPNLKDLHISGCSQLSSAPTSFRVLKELDVKDIQVSTGVRDIISITTNSLKKLYLSRVSGMRSLSDVTESSLSSCLKTLVILDCDDLSEISSSVLECCTCLESLTVVRCGELVSCPLNLQHNPCLSKIVVRGCPKLFTTDGTLPRGFQHLTNLKTLWIRPDNPEQSIDWDGLKTGCSTTLGTLYMTGSSRTQLPQQLEHFSSLVTLGISDFNSLERLPDWLGKLTSLQQLYLNDCPKLEHLPTEAIRSLSNLQALQIRRCPLLRETQGDEINALPDALPNLKLNWVRDC